MGELKRQPRFHVSATDRRRQISRVSQLQRRSSRLLVHFALWLIGLARLNRASLHKLREPRILSLNLAETFGWKSRVRRHRPRSMYRTSDFDDVEISRLLIIKSRLIHRLTSVGSRPVLRTKKIRSRTTSKGSVRLTATFFFFTFQRN